MTQNGFSKEDRYRELLIQLNGLCGACLPAISNLSNITAALHDAFQWWWCGFYFVQGDQLLLGPFQGPVACTLIQKGKGVCGSAWEKQQSIVVPNVHDFPGHIACSAISLSEIVVPVFKEGKVIGVIDVDSEFESHFDEIDRIYLEQVAELAAPFITSALLTH